MKQENQGKTNDVGHGPFDNVTGDFGHPTCVNNPFYDPGEFEEMRKVDKKALTREVLRRQSKVGYAAE